MNFESILDEIGAFDRYQKCLVLRFMAPTTFVAALYVLNVLFMVAVPEHRCRVPELESTNLTTIQSKTISIPKLPDGSFSRCTSYAVDYSEIIHKFQSTGELPKPHPNWPTRKCTHGWIYSNDLYLETIVSKWDLVCGKDYLPSLVLTLAQAGSVVGTFLFSVMADKQGRKTAFLANAAVAMGTGVLSVFSPTFAVFAVLRAITGTTVPSNFQLPYIITVEQVGPKHRARIVCISWMLWTSGACFLAFLAYISYHWATLGLITTLPVALFYSYERTLAPSARFLLSQGRLQEASWVLERLAKENGKAIPPDLLAKLQLINENVQSDKVECKRQSLLDLFRYPQLRKKLIVITLNWSAIAVAYFGLTINVNNLGGNDFLNFFLLSVVELPAFPLALYVMEKIGRRWSNTGFVLLTGTACLIPSFLAKDLEIGVVVASLMGKFGSAAAFMVIYQQAAELYPTPVRALGIGFGSTVSSMAVICMPYVCYLGNYNKAIPFLLIGALCVCAGLIAPLVPETLNCQLPQTISDSEKFGTGKGCFYLCSREQDVKKENEEDLHNHISSV